MDRTKLPYRKNCEGYFFLKDKVLAQDTQKGYILFPGGGFDNNEAPKQAIIRETFEETGAVIKNLMQMDTIKFDWALNWPRTEKQKKRYEQFRGEEMHLFSGEIERFETPKGDPDDEWKGEKLIDINELIKIIEKNKPFPENMKEYYEAQEKFLKGKII